MTAWLDEAKKYLGQKEIPGVASNSWIKSMWLGLKGGGWFWSAYGEDDSKLPWCGAFLAMVMKNCGIEYPKKYASALEWANWGQPLAHPALGAVAIFTRQGGGHVAIVAGQDDLCRIVCIGGNQGDMVCCSPFDTSRNPIYRWPPLMPLPKPKILPLIPLGSAKSSGSEA